MHCIFVTQAVTTKTFSKLTLEKHKYLPKKKKKKKEDERNLYFAVFLDFVLLYMFGIESWVWVCEDEHVTVLELMHDLTVNIVQIVVVYVALKVAMTYRVYRCVFCDVRLSSFVSLPLSLCCCCFCSFFLSMEENRLWIGNALCTIALVGHVCYTSEIFVLNYNINFKHTHTHTYHAVKHLGQRCQVTTRKRAHRCTRSHHHSRRLCTECISPSGMIRDTWNAHMSIVKR